MLISKRKAVAQYTSSTGRTVTEAKAAINQMPLDTSAKRPRVNSWHLDRLILNEKRRQEQLATLPITIRPISERRGQEIRDRCI